MPVAGHGGSIRWWLMLVMVNQWRRLMLDSDGSFLMVGLLVIVKNVRMMVVNDG